MQTVQNEIGAWMDLRPYSLIQNKDPDGARSSILVKVTHPPNLQRWSLVAGDCVHNLRSALDHLAWSVAVCESQPVTPRSHKSIAFPIADSPKFFRDSRAAKAASPRARAAFERAQPYNRPHPIFPPLIGLLRDLDDTDKHQLLQLLRPQFVGGEFSNLRGIAPEQPATFWLFPTEIVDGAKIATLIFDRPTPDVRYNFDLDMTIAIRHKPGPTGADRTDIKLLLAMLADDALTVVEETVTAYESG